MMQRGLPLPAGATAFADLIRFSGVVRLAVKSPRGQIFRFPEGVWLGFTVANRGWRQR
jgi:hypothetical protein